LYLAKTHSDFKRLDQDTQHRMIRAVLTQRRRSRGRSKNL
jgi:hypothetical protein